MKLKTNQVLNQKKWVDQKSTHLYVPFGTTQLTT
jgi:hypothetical protein